MSDSPSTQPTDPRPPRLILRRRRTPEELIKAAEKRAEQFTGARKEVSKSIAEREIAILREKDRLRREREAERRERMSEEKKENQILKAQKAEEKRIKRENEEQLLNIIPSAYTGSKYVREGGEVKQVASSLEDQRKRQAAQINKLFPKEPMGRTTFMYNEKPLKPSALDIQSAKKQAARDAKRVGKWVPIYNT